MGVNFALEFTYSVSNKVRSFSSTDKSIESIGAYLRNFSDDDLFQGTWVCSVYRLRFDYYICKKVNISTSETSRKKLSKISILSTHWPPRAIHCHASPSCICYFNQFATMTFSSSHNFYNQPNG